MSNKKPNMRKIILFLRSRGFTFKIPDEKKRKRMGFFGDDFDFVESRAKSKKNYTMDNQ